MADTYKVESIVGSRPWPDPDAPKVIYWDFKAEGVPQVCNIGRKPDRPLTVGESFEATSEEDRGKLKLKRVQQQNFLSGGRRDPQTEKRITRQHSQDMAIETLKLAHAMGVRVKTVPEPPDPPRPVSSVSDIVPLVKKLADAYDKDAWEAGL